MFGRVPNFVPAYGQPMEAYPQAYVPPPTYAAPAPQYARPMAAQASHPAAAPAATFQAPPRAVRAQANTDETRLELPSPEQLGLNRPAAPANPARVDWASVHDRLDRLGATCFHVEKLAKGARVTCLLPTSKADCAHRIEAVAGSEAEAVALAVNQAEQWAHAK